jgi:type IV pilus assembly protein PilE
MKRKGFSLVELMIAVVVVGVLAAIAIPTYTRHIQRGRMAQAYSDIQTIALLEEKAYAETASYKSYADLQTSFGLKIGNTQKYYNLAISGLSTTQFVISAEPQNDYIHKRPCMRSDGVQGYSNVANPSYAACSEAEWTTR